MATQPNPRAFPSGLDVLGMTLRDYFAAAALTGLLSNANVIAANSEVGYDICNNTAQGVAQEAWAWAESMLAEREKGDR